MRVKRVHRIAGLQDGLITRTQALAAGATPAMVRHALRRNGPWQVVLPGIYATFSGPLSWIHKLRAAVLHGGEGSMVEPMTWSPHSEPSSTRSTELQSARFRPSPDQPIPWHTDNAASRDCLPPWHVVVDELAPTARPGQIPVAPTARALVDAVRGMVRASIGAPSAERLRSVRALFCEAVQRRHCTVAELTEELRRTPRPDTASARLAMADVIAGCRSSAECDLRDTIKTSRVLPEPRWNQPLPGYERIAPDACWPEARLVVEVDSVAWHRYGDQYEETEKRRAVYATLGWRVIPISPFRLRTEPAQVRLEIEQAYQAGLPLAR